MFFFSWGKELDFSIIESLFITQGNFDELFCCCFSILVGFLFIHFWCVAKSGFCPLPPILVIHVFCATLKLWSGGLLFCNRREERFFFLYQEQVSQQKAMASRTSPMRTLVPRGKTSSLDSSSNSRVQQQQPRGSSGQQLQGGNQVPLARCEFDGNRRGLRHTLGEMTTVCGKCGALHFLEERATSSSRANPQFTLCCAQGKVTLPPLAPALEPFRWLFTGNEADAKHFVNATSGYP